MSLDRGGDAFGELFAVHGQRGAGRHAHTVGLAHDERSEPTHLFFEQTHGVVELVAAERITADQFGQPVRLVHGRRHRRSHLRQQHRHAHRRRLPRRLAARQSAADDVDCGARRLATILNRHMGFVGPLRGQASCSSLERGLSPFLSRSRRVPILHSARNHTPRCCRGAGGHGAS
jgi:hypothetical protein